MESIRKLEAELWEAADLLRAGSKLTSKQYCMPVLGLIFLRYAYSRFRMVEREIMKDRPVRNGRAIPVEKSDFIAKSALYLPKEAQYAYLLNLPADIKKAHIADRTGREIASLGEAVNNAMELTEEQSPKLAGILPKDYAQFDDSLLSELLKIFNNSALDDVGGDVIGRIYEYFLNKFAKNIASDDGVFFTPKSLVKMIVNVLEPRRGILLDPACGSGGMFVQTGDFVNRRGMSANNVMTFYGQEKVDYNSRLCLMNMAVHGLSAAHIASGDDANTFYHDAHHLAGKCDYVMANPQFNVDKVKAESAQSAGRLPFGLPGVNKKSKEVSNANYLWISYFYAYLNESGRAGFVMASSATDSQGRDKEIRRQLVETGHMDVMVSAGNNFFYTKSLPCSLWFFDKGKPEALQDKVLFIDARNYYTAVDRTLNEWTEQQLQNLNAIVWLYRGETEKYRNLIQSYRESIRAAIDGLRETEEAAAFRKATGAAPEGVAPCDNPEAYLDALDETLAAAKRAAETAIAEKRRRKKAVNAAHSAFESAVRDIQRAIREYLWLTEKFGETGECRDIPGLCRIATREEIAEKGYSLTPGAYVGVAPTEDDGVQFASRMGEIHRELLTFQEESGKLMDVISRNLKEMGL